MLVLNKISNIIVLIFIDRASREMMGKSRVLLVLQVT